MRCPCATEEQLIAFERVHGRIPAVFREFLSALGGGVVGSEWVDGITQLEETLRKFKAESGETGWRMPQTFVIGWHGSGNPFGINTLTGAVVAAEHNFGGLHELAPSFEVFLRRGVPHNEAYPFVQLDVLRLATPASERKLTQSLGAARAAIECSLSFHAHPAPRESALQVFSPQPLRSRRRKA
jgi:SMI1 / KNR4 family (SUKH-1)